MNFPPVLFTPPGFTRNLSTPVAWEVLSFEGWGWGAGGLTAFHTCFSRQVVSTVLETTICGMTLKKKKKTSCWYWTFSVFVKFLFCINTTFDKHL